jgi:hypothetical protein
MSGLIKQPFSAWIQSSAVLRALRQLTEDSGLLHHQRAGWAMNSVKLATHTLVQSSRSGAKVGDDLVQAAVVEARPSASATRCGERRAPEDRADECEVDNGGEPPKVIARVRVSKLSAEVTASRGVSRCVCKWLPASLPARGGDHGGGCIDLKCGPRLPDLFAFDE